MRMALHLVSPLKFEIKFYGKENVLSVIFQFIGKKNSLTDHNYMSPHGTMITIATKSDSKL
jgi:hypothetical protein